MVGRKEKEIALYVLIVLFALHCFRVNPTVVGYGGTSPWWTHFTYAFFHASWLHLLINSYSFYFVYNERIFKSFTIWIAIIISILASCIFTPRLPTVGASGIIFAMIGINTVLTRQATYHLCVCLALCSGFIMQGVNATLYLSCFLLGLFASLLYTLYCNYRNDCTGINS